jgi:thiol-disulfide isomerase/thioredoxin/predicted small lipoprotein YifL
MMKKAMIGIACLALTLTACGNQKPAEAPTQAPTSVQETATEAQSQKTVQDYLDEENAILAQDKELWEKVFASMSKNVSDDTLSSNYGDVLLAAVEGIKDELSDEEYQTLKGHAQKIHDLEEEISALPTEEAAPSQASAGENAFPQFEGKDLDGNPVDSSLFANNAFTVINFWFSGCKPCVGEMKELEELSKTIREQGGELIGVNTETLDGNADAIATAKKILESKGVTYRNIYFDSSSEAAKFALNIMAFPTTYVFDRNGNVVGEPLLGGIDNPSNLERLQQTIADAIAADASNAVSADAIPADALPAGAVVTGK